MILNVGLDEGLRNRNSLPACPDTTFDSVTSPVTASTAVTVVPLGMNPCAILIRARSDTSAPTWTTAASATGMFTMSEEKVSTVVFVLILGAPWNRDSWTRKLSFMAIGAFTMILLALKSAIPSVATPRFGELIGLLIVTVESGAGRSTENPASRDRPGATVTVLASSDTAGDA